MMTAARVTLGNATMMRQDDFVSELLAWLNDKLAPPGVRIVADTPLFAGGLMNSIRILELIAWTERAIGREIPDVMIRMDNFQTVACIAEVFWSAGQPSDDRHVVA